MESGDRDILKKMNKETTPEQYIQAVELLNTHGISTQLYFIIGFPGETPQTIKNTVNMINQFQHTGPAINEVVVFPYVLAPLSPVYTPENRGKYNLRGYMSEWEHYTMDSKLAHKYAQDFFFNLEYVYPHYAMEEFDVLEVSKLKKISQLRSQICKAERLQDSPQIIDHTWRELREAVVYGVGALAP